MDCMQRSLSAAAVQASVGMSDCVCGSACAGWLSPTGQVAVDDACIVQQAHAACNSTVGQVALAVLAGCWRPHTCHCLACKAGASWRQWCNPPCPAQPTGYLLRRQQDVEHVWAAVGGSRVAEAPPQDGLVCRQREGCGSNN